MPMWKRVVKFFDLTTVGLSLLIISSLWTFSRRTNRILLIASGGLLIT